MTTSTNPHLHRTGPQDLETLRADLLATILEGRGVADGLALRVRDDQKAVRRLAELLTLHAGLRRFRITVESTSSRGGRWVLCTGPDGLRNRLVHLLLEARTLAAPRSPARGRAEHHPSPSSAPFPAEAAGG